MNWGQSLANVGIYLGIPFVLLMFIGQYIWWKRAKTMVKVIEVKTIGGTRVHYVPKEGNVVTIENKEMGVTRSWPVHELATIPMPYPEIGLLPEFLMREIQTVILIEGDWEPLLNRSPHRKGIMSPDALEFLRGLAHKYGLPEKDNDGNEVKAALAPDMADEVDEFLKGVSTGPTRYPIAAPDVLGALKVSTVMKALASVSDDLLEALKQIRNQLARFAGLNAMLLYVLLAFSIILSGASLFVGVKTLTNPPAASATLPSDVSTQLDDIKRALGIPIKPAGK